MHCLQIGDNLAIHKFSEKRLQTLKDLTKKNNIRLELGAKELTPHHLQLYLELAAKLNAPLLRFVIDHDSYQPDINTIKSIIRNVLPFLKEKNIILGIENHDRLKVKEFATLMESINSSNVGICLDCVNSMGAGEGLEYVASILAPFTVNLHIKDFKVERLLHKMGFYRYWYTCRKRPN